MIPLIFAAIGEEQIIHKIVGDPAERKHLENLGFVAGGNITVLSSNDGDVVIKVKETSVAINREMAEKILV